MKILKVVEGSFNAPKGLFCISPFVKPDRDLYWGYPFQCPEGLNLFSIWPSWTDKVSATMSFNAPKG